MTQITLIIIGIAVIVILLTRKTRERVAGICSSALDQTVRKSANKEKIIAFLVQKGEVSNAEFRKSLGISERSVIRYMDELEREGKVEQVGKTGRGVLYRLK